MYDATHQSDAVLLPDNAITAAGTSTVGVLGPAQFDANDNVFYLAFFDGTNQRIYSSTPSASMQPQAFTAAVATNNVGAAKVTSFALSPDRSTIAFVEDATTQTAFELFTADTAGVNAKTPQTTGHTAGQSISNLAQVNWNHAGTAIAFHADYGATANKFQPYVLTLSTHGLKRIATVGLDTDATRNSQDALAWSTDDATVFVISDGGTTDNAFSVSAQSATTTDGAITFLVTPPTSGDIFDVFTR